MKHDQITSTGLEADIFLSKESSAASAAFIIIRNSKVKLYKVILKYVKL
jgi:hypothetical protein